MNDAFFSALDEEDSSQVLSCLIFLIFFLHQTQNSPQRKGEAELTLDNDELGDEDEDDEEVHHMKTLEGLKETDPEFYKYLQQNDKELLAFGKNKDSDEKEDEDNEGEKETEEEELEAAHKTGKRVNSKVLKAWATSALKVRNDDAEERKRHQW